MAIYTVSEWNIFVEFYLTETNERRRKNTHSTHSISNANFDRTHAATENKNILCNRKTKAEREGGIQISHVGYIDIIMNKNHIKAMYTHSHIVLCINGSIDIGNFFFCLK